MDNILEYGLKMVSDFWIPQFYHAELRNWWGSISHLYCENQTFLDYFVIGIKKH